LTNLNKLSPSKGNIPENRQQLDYHQYFLAS
jgi:hypothetical protein